MWKPLQMSPPYLLKFIQNDQTIHIDVTNYTKCWLRDLDSKTFLNYLKESNDGLEFDDNNELIDRGIDMLTHPEILKKVSVSQISNTLKIAITKKYEITLRLELSLEKSSSEHFSQVVVQPLLKTICDLRSSQHELRQALLKKDREIEEYKMEGRAPRRLITTIYDDLGHMNKHTAFEECFGSNSEEIADLLKSVTVPKDASELKQNDTSDQTVKPNSSECCIKPEVTKVEKHSENTNVDEMPEVQSNIALRNQDIKTDIIKNEIKIDRKEILPSPKKRQRNKLNF